MTNFKTENKTIKFDRNNLLYYVDVVTTDSDNFTQYATMYFDRKGRSFSFEPFSETISISNANINGRHYYTRTAILSAIQRIEPMFDETHQQMKDDDTARLYTLFESATSDAIIKANGNAESDRMAFDSEVLF